MHFQSYACFLLFEDGRVYLRWEAEAKDKLAIIKQRKLESSSANIIAECYGVGKSTVSDIKKNRDKILCFQQEIRNMGMSKKPKVMKVGDDEQHNKAVYLWCKQKWMEGVPGSGLILCEKANQLHKMYGEESSFSGSTGRQWRFCKRHRIRNLSLEGEKLSVDTEASATFITFSIEFVEEHLTLNQIFNCDETASFHHSADKRKQSKERVTINACANATGTTKLPLQVIGKQNTQGVLEVWGWNSY